MAVEHRWLQHSPTQEGANASLTISDAITNGDMYVAVDIGNYSTLDQHGTALAGLGASWTRQSGAQTMMSEVWVGVGTLSLPPGQTVTLTAPALSPTTRRRLIIYCFRGVSSTVALSVVNGTSTTVTTADTAVGPDQVAVSFGYSDSGANALKNLTPASGWATPTQLDLHSSTRYTSISHRIPTVSETHKTSASRASGATMVTLVRLGSDATPPLTSTFVGWGNPIF